MIYFFVQTNPNDTIGKYLRGRGETLAQRIQVVNYGSLRSDQLFKPGFYIFTDMDRLNQHQMRVVCNWVQKLEQNPNITVWNSPLHALVRYDLIKKLYTEGINLYKIIKASESWEDLQFPVFLREGFGHNRLISPMIKNYHELKREILLKQLLGYQLQEILVIEFLNTSDKQGLFHKFSALKVGDVILPRYLDFKAQWLVKSDARGIKNPINRERLAEIKDYMEQNPHQEWLAKVFKVANIDYGRIDYSLLDGIPQAWEINMNPDYGSRKPSNTPLPTATYEGTIEQLKKQFFDQFRRQLEKISDSISNTDTFQLELPEGYQQAFPKKKENSFFANFQQSENILIGHVRSFSTRLLSLFASLLLKIKLINFRKKIRK